MALAMTSVCDTTLLITFRFPPSEEVRQKITRLLQRELSQRLLVPSIVSTEYIKAAGRKVGIEAAVTHIHELESRGASVTDINRQVALEAGRLLAKHPDVPIADALLAASAIVYAADHVVTNDPHFRKMSVKTLWI